MKTGRPIAFFQSNLFIVVVFLCSFWLDPKRTKKVKIVVRFCPHARAGSHDNQATALLN
jgi:hypothetical protein